MAGGASSRLCRCREILPPALVFGDVGGADYALGFDDGEIEEGKVAPLALDLKLRPDRPNVARSQRRLGAD
jgi:hypothetical protein